MKLYSFFSAVSLLGTILVFCCSYLQLTSLDKHNMATLSPDRNQPYSRIYYNNNKSLTTNPGKKILILAYPRTGSSLLGEIISVEENFSYFFEPLHSLRSDIRWKNQVAPNTEYINNFLRNLFTCEESGIRKFRKDKFILRKSKNVFCSKESNVLIKAIRLTSEHIAELLQSSQDNLPDLKIIHLVRDPRAILSSMLSQPKAWRAYLQGGGDGTKICGNMENNLRHFRELRRTKQLNDKNFLEINYDQWMENLWVGMVRLFSFLDIKITPEMVARIQEHFQGNSWRRGYLSTYRGSEHDKDSWKTKLDLKTLELLERNCKHLLYNDDDDQEDDGTEVDDSSTTKYNITQPLR